MISSNDMQALKNVSAFFNFLNDPESYKKILIEVNKSLEEMEKTTKLFTSIEAFEKFQADAKLKLAQEKEKFEKEKDVFNATSLSRTNALNTRASSLAEKEAAYDKKAALLKTATQAVEDQLLDIQAEYEKLHLKKEETQERAIAVTALQAELTAKLAKVTNALEAM